MSERLHFLYIITADFNCKRIGSQGEPVYKNLALWAHKSSILLLKLLTCSRCVWTHPNLQLSPGANLAQKKASNRYDWFWKWNEIQCSNKIASTFGRIVKFFDMSHGYLITQKRQPNSQLSQSRESSSLFKLHLKPLTDKPQSVLAETSAQKLCEYNDWNSFPFIQID